MERLIPEQDQERMQNALRSDHLPDVVEKTYWGYKWLRDVLDSGPLRSEEIAMILLLAGCRGEPPVEREVTVYETLTLGRYPEGYPIEVYWRNRPVEAEFFAIVPQGFTARLKGEGEVRTFASDRIVTIGQPA
jgi:hypothetical protein